MRLRIEEFENRHHDGRVWIIGNGPSLLKLTHDQHTRIQSGLQIGVNRCWKRGHPDGPNPEFRGFKTPDYHLCVNGLQGREVIDGEVRPATAFVSDRLRWQYARYNRNWCTIQRAVDMAQDPTREFEPDITLGYYAHFAGLIAIQLAAFMGCQEIVLVGFDGNDGEGHHYDENPYEGSPGSQQRSRLMLPWYQSVANWAARNGVSIFNVNPNSAIECFDHVPVANIGAAA